MMIRRFRILLPFQILWAAATAAVVNSAQSTTVCSAGECLTGQSNVTRLGAVLSSSGTSYVLLPGQYSSTVQPSTLEQALSSATSTITYTTGFSNSTNPSTPSLPLTIALQPGLLTYPSEPYTGDPTFLTLPQSADSSFNTTNIGNGSIILASNVFAAIQAENNGAKTRVIVWDNVPYRSQLPYDMSGSLQVLSIQSSKCSPACSASGICSLSGSCLCPPNFTGNSCESCSSGHFGPQCKACPSGCTQCDEGITGTGICLTPTLPANDPSNCNCQNGVCGSGGTCTCSAGWTSGTGNSTQCNTCASGFFLDSSGNCESCGAGCTTCAASTGACLACQSGLTPSSGDNKNCVPIVPTGSVCSGNTFPSSGSCSPCNAACATCSGPTSADCASCATGTYFLGGTCVGLVTGSTGVCVGSSLVANNNKGVCDTCPLGCSTCSYTNFNSQSPFSGLTCTACYPGKFLSGGQCVDSCPKGTFGENGSCTACSSSCATCLNSADFCTSCQNSQFASQGSCVSSCPSSTFSNSTSNTCTLCHPDCASCSGPSFDQCLSCPANNPVLTSDKRCVAACSKTQYFDSSSNTCESCDSSCASCSTSGGSGCLSCASSTQVLRGGQCINVNCGSGAGPTSGLGVCLAELVQVPSNSGPPTSIPPINPNASQPPSHSHGLAWWEILLIVLGILFLLAIILLCWRRRQRKKRAQQTEQFKQNMQKRGLWSRLWRNPFAGWWARRRSAMINRRSRSDVERMSDVKGWRSPAHSGTDDLSPGLGSDRRTAVGVPKSIGRGSWVTTGFPPSERNERGLGLGAIRESREWENDRYTERSYRSGSRRRDDSRFYGQEIEQDDGRSERTRSERTYDQYQYPRPSSRNSDDRTDLVSIIRSEVPESERRYPYDERDRESRRQYSERSRSNYGRSERSHRDRSIRQDYPASVSTESQSRSYDRDRRPPYPSSSSHGPDTPSMYSQPTLPHIRPPPPAMPAAVNPFDVDAPRDAVLSSRFSMSTTAASTHPPAKTKRKDVPDAVPPLEPPRKLTDAEMYKMSKLFPDLLGLMSPKKAANTIDGPEGVKSPSRNPFRI